MHWVQFVRLKYALVCVLSALQATIVQVYFLYF